MNGRLAKYRSWLVPVIWDAGEPEPAAAQATVVHVVHHYLPAPDGAGPIPGGLVRDAITEGNQ